MARAFRRQGRGESRRYVARLDAGERDLLASLMEQVVSLMEPPEAQPTGDDEFGRLVAGLSLQAGPEPPDDGEDRDPGQQAGDQQPRDPALDRLFPAAHREDAEAAQEFRRITEGGLRHRKASGLSASVAALRTRTDDVSLDADQARLFLTALTDVRLVLGSRLGVERDEDLERLEAVADELGPDDALSQTLGLYDFLTWLQETLASALLRR